MPLRCEGAPNAFVGIGPKRSGDVYTSTDLSLLSAVAHGVSARLERSISEGCLPPRGRGSHHHYAIGRRISLI
jgi:hypothetical protein